MNDGEINAEVGQLLRYALLPASPGLIEKWRLLARNIAGVRSVDEGLCFVRWATRTALKRRETHRWPDDFKPYAFTWRDQHGPEYRRRFPAGGQTAEDSRPQGGDR